MSPPRWMLEIAILIQQQKIVRFVNQWGVSAEALAILPIGRAPIGRGRTSARGGPLAGNATSCTRAGGRESRAPTRSRVRFRPIGARSRRLPPDRGADRDGGGLRSRRARRARLRASPGARLGGRFERERGIVRAPKRAPRPIEAPAPARGPHSIERGRPSARAGDGYRKTRSFEPKRRHAAASRARSNKEDGPWGRAVAPGKTTWTKRTAEDATPRSARGTTGDPEPASPIRRR